MRNRWWAGLILAAAAVSVAACGSNGSPASTATSHPVASAAAQGSSDEIKTMSTSNGTVLVDARGLTLYWFANDSATASNCTGSCTTYWPPLMGTAVAAAGTSLPHGFGTIKRANGQIQATYDGHPLYYYVGDTGAGTVNGQGSTGYGAYWWILAPSGAPITSSVTVTGASPSSSSGNGNGGDGY